MILRFSLGIALSAALSACGTGSTDATADAADATPPLWEIRSASGEVEGWMLGTIHALPDGVEWRTNLIDAKLDTADLLVVEVAGLGDKAALSRLFTDLAFDQVQGPVIDRLRPDNRARFEQLLVGTGMNMPKLNAMETWAAALTLAQLDMDAKSSNGVDRALMADFPDGKVVELEGAANQLSIFDSLPEKEQRDLLNAVLDELVSKDQQEVELADAWRAGDLDHLAALSKRGILADPELRQKLLVERNAAWVRQIDVLLSDPKRPFIAVGTGHMIGPEGLPTHIGQSGYTVTRIQ